MVKSITASYTNRSNGEDFILKMSSCYLSTNSFKYKVDLNKINPGGLQLPLSQRHEFKNQS